MKDEKVVGQLDVLKDNYAQEKVQLKEKIKNQKAVEKQEFLSKKAKCIEEHNARLAELKANLANASDDKKEELKLEISNEKYYHKHHMNDIQKEYKEKQQAHKDEINDTFLAFYREAKKVSGDKVGLGIKLQRKVNDEIYKFNLKQFLLSNGLYMIIIAFIIAAIIIAPAIGRGNLLTGTNILTILEQSSTRIFFALGVAGLILLGGTDLSIGRLVGLGAVITCIILHPGENIIKIFGITTNFDSVPMFVRVLMSLSLSVLFCVLFSALAGFFTAKLNMHPFVTTLATQLIVFGLLCFATNTTSSGTIDFGIKNMLAGRLGGVFPTLIIYAVICIAVVWFIWNKTRFGKNMYAVGGNKEAAAVSGINVFKTTLLVFVFAGVLYGIGSFLEGLRIGTAVATTGTGYELDAIAACVVGGISFSGGIGKVKGAVVGVVLFTAITYILTFLGLDANIQFILKGAIIMSAVALDSVKYLKRK